MPRCSASSPHGRRTSGATCTRWGRTRPGASRIAWAVTRPAKGPGTPYGELARDWARRAACRRRSARTDPRAERPAPSPRGARRTPFRRRHLPHPARRRPAARRRGGVRHCGARGRRRPRTGEARRPMAAHGGRRGGRAAAPATGSGAGGTSRARVGRPPARSGRARGLGRRGGGDRRLPVPLGARARRPSPSDCPGARRTSRPCRRPASPIISARRITCRRRGRGSACVRPSRPNGASAVESAPEMWDVGALEVASPAARGRARASTRGRG